MKKVEQDLLRNILADVGNKQRIVNGGAKL